jgi:hypothetical protein
MKNYQKLFISITAVCLFAVCAAPACAAIPTRAKVKARDFIAKASKSLGDAIWQNKASVAIGATAVGVATNPAPFVSGITTILTGRPSDPSAGGIQSYIVGYVFYAIATLLAIIGVRCAWNYVKDYKNWLPLMVVGVLLCSVGVAEAGMIAVPDTQSGFIYRPWWDVISIVILIITIFIGV